MRAARLLAADLRRAASLIAAARRRSAPASYRQKMRTFHTAEEFARVTAGKVTIDRRIDPAQEAALHKAYVQLPNTQVTVIKASPASGDLGRHARGRHPPEPRLSNPRVFRRQALASRRSRHRDRLRRRAPPGSKRPRAMRALTYVPMTLAEKSRAFVNRVQARHNRWGLTADSHLRVPGDLSTNQMVSSDNDGLWTAMYVAAECFRYKVTGEADARANARQGMNALIRLEAITGIPGFPARSFIKVGEDVQPQDGEWHDTPDRSWRWKGDTSSDEIVGHYFVYPIYHDLVADETEKPALRAVIERITNHILDNNYQLIGPGGKRTRWGWWGPAAIWEDPDETGLRALHILSHLRVAHAPDGERAVSRAVSGGVSGADQDAQVSLADPQPEGHGARAASIIRTTSWRSCRTTRCCATKRIPRCSRSTSRASNAAGRSSGRSGTRSGTSSTPSAPARRSPTRRHRCARCARSRWTSSSGPSRNSHRLDVPVDPLSDRFKRRQALIVLPYDELPMSKWNGNPYSLDGGSGRTERRRRGVLSAAVLDGALSQGVAGIIHEIVHRRRAAQHRPRAELRPARGQRACVGEAGSLLVSQGRAGGHIWLNVDAEHGVREPLFDHQRLAIELNLRSGSEFTPLTLPFADPASRFVVKYDGSNAYIQEGAMAIEFVLDGQHWRCELQVKWDWNKVPPTDYECLPRRPVVAATDAPARPAPPSTVKSPDGKWEAFVQHHNVAVARREQSATRWSSARTACRRMLIKPDRSAGLQIQVAQRVSVTTRYGSPTPGTVKGLATDRTVAGRRGSVQR